MYIQKWKLASPQKQVISLPPIHDLTITYVHKWRCGWGFSYVISIIRRIFDKTICYGLSVHAYFPDTKCCIFLNKYLACIFNVTTIKRRYLDRYIHRSLTIHDNLWYIYYIQESYMHILIKLYVKATHFRITALL